MGAAEGAIQRKALEAINRTGLAKVFRCQSGLVQVRRGWMHLSPAGTPDLVGWMLDGSGRFVGIEVKVPGKKELEQQGVVRGEILAAGGVAGVARSVAEAVDIVRIAAARQP